MRHIQSISRGRPAMAQFEPVLELISVFQALVSLISNSLRLIGEAEDYLDVSFLEKKAAG